MAIRWQLACGRWWAGGLLCLVVMGLTALLVNQQLDAARQTEQGRFAQEVRTSTQALSQRLQGYVRVVAGFQNLFIVDPQLSRRQFEQVAQQHDVLGNYPELVNLSFARHVPAAELADYELRMRAQIVREGGASQPFVHPGGLSSDHHVVEFLWPAQGNEGILGLDIASQPANLAAVLAARDTRGPVLSAPFHLIQDSQGEQAFLVRFPVFAPAEGESPQQASQFIGAVASIVRVGDMFDAVREAGFLRDLSVRLFDAGDQYHQSDQSDQPAGAQLIAEGRLQPFGQSRYPGSQPMAEPLQVVQELNMLGRYWLLEYTQARPLLSAGERWLPWWIAGAGGTLALLLGSLFNYVLGRHRLAVSDIAATHRALEHSEERFRAMFSQAAIGVSLSDAQTGRLERVNRRYVEILGYPEAELLQMTFQSLTHPDDLAEDLALSQQLQDGLIPEFQMEKRMLHKDGRIVWVELTVSPVFQAEDEPIHHIAVIQDITQRRQMQDTLRDSEHHLRTLLDHLPVGVALVDQAQKIVFRNQQFLQVCGYSAADAPDVRTWWALTIPDAADRRQVRRAWEYKWREARESGRNRAYMEYLILCKDGLVRPVELSGLEFGSEYLMTLVDLTSRKEAEKEIHYLAYNDPLTQLPNRRLLVDRLEQALAESGSRQRYGALLMLDLDHFKTLNETRGHEVGDELLRQVAQRLKNCLGAGHTVARHGDDEFAIVLAALSGQAEEAARQAEAIGQSILNTLRAPYQLRNAFYHSSVSMGASLFRGRGGGVDELLRRADLAMYQAKAAGRNTLTFYDPRMQDAVHGRAALEADIRIGLEQSQFELFYQAQVEHDSVAGCEALLRWQHPRDGYVSPATFIPLAEESGLILPLGDWVLRSACHQLAVWAEDPDLASLQLAINVSPRQFRQADFVEQVLAALAGTGANAHRLELELTEGLLLQNLEDTVQKMMRLKSYGLRFALDDFGTGYSSLAYLKRLPLDLIKIDQSFVRDVLTDPNDAAIARTIVALGNSLGLKVIAEGVETEAQRDFLRRHQCHAWQGYLFSRPLPLADFETLVKADRHRLRTTQKI